MSEHEKRDQFVQNEETHWGHGMKKYLEIGVVAFLVIAACLVFYFVLFRFAVIEQGIKAIISVSAPIILGFVFAYILNPVVMLLESCFMKIYEKHKAKTAGKKSSRKSKPKKVKAESDDNAEVTNQNPALVGGRKGARRVAVLASVIMAVTFVSLLIIAVLPALADSVSQLAEDLPGYYNKVSAVVIKFVEEHEWIAKNIPDVNQLLDKINVFDVAGDYINSILSTAYNWVVIAFNVVFNVVIGLIIAMYLLGGKERYIGQAKKICFAVMQPERAKKFVQNMHKANQIFKSAILGKILDSIIIGFLCFIGMSILGMCGFEAIERNTVLLSVVVGVTNVIPFFGPFIGGVPSAILVFCQSPIDGIVFALFILVLQQFDCNYLDPRIVGRSVGLSPIYVLCFCLIGGGMFGIVGMLTATPTGAIIYGIAKSWFESKLEVKELPLETKEYATKPGARIKVKSEE